MLPFSESKWSSTCARINLLGSSTTEAPVFQRIIGQTCDTADKLGITIVTGHIGTFNGLFTVVGVCTGYGHVKKDRLITPAGAQAGDYIVCAKPVGLETIVNFTVTHGTMAEKLLVRRELSKLVILQICVKEALLLAEIEGLHAMHDATEGGLTAALNEIAEASDVGFKVRWENLLIPEEVHMLRVVSVVK